MKTRLVLIAMVAAVLLTGVLWPGSASTAQVPSPQSAAQQSQATPDMMKMHEQMMADMAAGNARLEALVKDMNAASGDARVTAITAVVNELVRQHTSMQERMGQMHQQMMGGRGMMMNR